MQLDSSAKEVSHWIWPPQLNECWPLTLPFTVLKGKLSDCGIKALHTQDRLSLLLDHSGAPVSPQHTSRAMEFLNSGHWLSMKKKKKIFPDYSCPQGTTVPDFVLASHFNQKLFVRKCHFQSCGLGGKSVFIKNSWPQ